MDYVTCFQIQLYSLHKYYMYYHCVILLYIFFISIKLCNPNLKWFNINWFESLFIMDAQMIKNRKMSLTHLTKTRVLLLVRLEKHTALVTQKLHLFNSKFCNDVTRCTERKWNILFGKKITEWWNSSFFFCREQIFKILYDSDILANTKT